MTAARGREWRKYLDKELYTAELATHKANLAAIDKGIDDDKKARAKALEEARAECKARHQAVKERADETYAKAVELAKALAKEEREAAKTADRDRCKLDKDHVRAEAAAKIAGKRAKPEEAKRFHALVNPKSRRKETDKRTQRAESNDEVRHNIEPALIPLFERVKGGIKGDARKSRTEAFLEYVESHEGEAMQAREQYGEKLLQADLRQQRREAKQRQAAELPF